jgi:hypothetical protein
MPDRIVSATPEPCMMYAMHHKGCDIVARRCGGGGVYARRRVVGQCLLQIGRQLAAGTGSF